MAKKSRLGADPLGWIKDSRDEEKNELVEVTERVTKPKTLQINRTAEVKNPGRPKVTRDAANASQMGLRDGWTRATFILREEFLEKLKDLSYWDRKSLKEILDDIMENHLKKLKVKQRPKRGDS